MQPQKMSRDQLVDTAQDHEKALLRLRRAIGLIGVFLPFILLVASPLDAVGMQNSISEFFFTPLRDVLVLSLSAIGVFLINYHGHDPDDKEVLTDWRVSTFAGVTVLIVALVPTMGPAYSPLTLFDGWIASDTLQNLLHLGAAGAFLTALAIMCLKLFTKTDDPDPPQDKKTRNALFIACGWLILAMVALLLLMKVILRSTGQAWDAAWHFTFWAEAVAVWAFGVSWLVKGEALRMGATRFLYGAPEA